MGTELSCTPFEKEYFRKDGSRVPVLLSAAVLEQDRTEYVCSVVDLTEAKRAEQERLDLWQQVQHTQKLESLGVLAGGIAHDFNNLLMGVIGNADLALLEISPDSPARANIKHIEKAAFRATELCGQMLAYSGKGKFVVEPIDLSSVVKEMAHLLEVSTSKKALLNLNLASGLPAVEVDVTQIRQVIMNMITNASESIGDESGTIIVSTGTIACDRERLSDMLLGKDLKEGLYIYLEVSDTGCGMNAETLEKIFDPFYTTKFSGRGLGLAAVQGIVRSHNGAIEVFSEPACGTTIKVLLPASELEPIGAAAEVISEESWCGAGTILLVDDEQIVRTVCSQMLQRVGFEVIIASDGREAIETILQRGDEIKLVLLDMTMPLMDGQQTFSEIRKLGCDIPVILSSGHNEQEATSSFLGEGLAGFIQKPYRLTMLREKLREVLGGD